MRLPLSSVLSQAYVALTIEFDNEWERRLHQAGWAPRFLVSYAMWANFMRWVTSEGITVRELEERAGVWNGPIGLNRMDEWWGYVSVEPAAKSKKYRPEAIVRPSASGELALSKWEGLEQWVHQAWKQRFGTGFSALAEALESLEERLDLDLPDSMPVLGYADGYATPRPTGDVASPARTRPSTIGGALARVLLALTLEFEEGSALPLALQACVLRVIGNDPIPARDVPILAGVRKEATDPALKFLSKREFVVLDGTGAKASVRLTQAGIEQRRSGSERLAHLEEAWSARYGDAVPALRAALESLDDGTVAEGLRPPEKCWRGTKPYLAQTEAFLKSPRAHLPHHPLLTHRGGWPTAHEAVPLLRGSFDRSVPPAHRGDERDPGRGVCVGDRRVARADVLRAARLPARVLLGRRAGLRGRSRAVAPRPRASVRHGRRDRVARSHPQRHDLSLRDARGELHDARRQRGPLGQSRGGSAACGGADE